MILREVFTLPHVIHMDSTGLHWIPVPILPGQIGWYNAQSSPVQSTGLSLDCKPLLRVQSQSSGLRVQSKSTGVQWIALDSTGLDTIPCIVQNIDTMRIKHSPPQHITCAKECAILQLHHRGNVRWYTDIAYSCCGLATPKLNVGKRRCSIWTSSTVHNSLPQQPPSSTTPHATRHHPH